MKFTGATVQKFNRTFATEEDCKAYLFAIKWKNGYRCRKCDHDLSYKGETKFHQRCRLCDYDESVTAHTIFHKIKFPLLKAFGITFYVMTRKKGISTMELSRCFGIRQTTAWLFKRKLQEAIKSNPEQMAYPGTYHIDIQVGGSEIEVKSHFQGTEKKARISFIRKGRKIAHASGRVLNPDNSPDVNIRSLNMEASSNLKVKKISQRIPGPNVVILNLKNWLRCIHHHCSGHFTSGYLDEFFFRFNNRNQLKLIWHSAIEKMMAGSPYFYRPVAPK